MSTLSSSTTGSDQTTIQNEYINVVVTYELRKDKFHAFLQAIRPVVINANKAEGCLRFNIHQDQKNKCKIVLMEEWKGHRYMRAHLKAEYVKKFNEEQKKQNMAIKPPTVYFCGEPLISIS
mmetsp:Transcript_20455/g.32746  ORF Transcript_20455/g.32746 Transcript_20455/m.32746 type:complete len:121 (-) Transcript_20455:204-566(-)